MAAEKTPADSPRDDADAASDLAALVAQVAGRKVARLDEVDATGSYMPTRHYRAVFEDATSLFVKEATEPWTASLLERERQAYELLGARDFLPRCVGGNERVLLLEDLGDAYWPPPWRPSDLGRVTRALGDIAATTPPVAFPSLEASGLLRCWEHVARDPTAFLSLGLCSSEWFAVASDVLVSTDATPLTGDSLVHSDFRGDNLCIVDERVVVIDWPGASRGRSDFDRTAFAVTFAADTGERPEQVAPNADPALVAVISGPLARYAANPSVPVRVRDQLVGQLRVALPWAARLLGLPFR